MEREVTQSKAYQDALREMAEELRGHLPAGSREELLGLDTAALAQILRDVASEGAEDVLAYLRSTDKGYRQVTQRIEVTPRNLNFSDNNNLSAGL